MEYRTTLNLPKTTFPMKAGLKEKEPKILKKWEDDKIYNELRKLRADAPTFILHDGPPYANGDIHIGTAMNKILKDIIVRYKSILGFNSPYIPGWDCHGMPIEQKIVEQLGDKYKETSTNIVRKKCRAYAQKQVANQMKQFKRLGVMGDFDNPYLTMSPTYEAEIVFVFSKLVELGYIYKGLRTIHWCMKCETALAAAEIEYDEHHKSRSVYVHFPVKNKIDGINGELSVMIWTTTPWTLPANVALAFNERIEYVAVKIQNGYSIMARSLVESTLSKQGIDFSNIEMHNISIDQIKSLDILHPFIEGRKSSVVFANYVDDSAGTGVVHTAPGHGTDDYNTGVKNNLEIYCPVDREGKYTSDFPLMQGVSVMEANSKIIELLKKMGLLYQEEILEHSYPVCWRCKTPLIFRATDQWFMDMKQNGLDEKTLGFLDKLNWVPSWGQERMRSMLADRPDWCLSRQRAWGVPIPAFYCKDCGETLLTPESARSVAEIVAQKGIDVWFDTDAAELLPKGTSCKCGGTEFGKENDILDVWFDSGVSSFSIAKTHKLSFPVDVYLEGGDQYRGWFQSSIWPKMAIDGVPPYKELLTHGWVLDESGHAMHKSKGNTIAPSEIVDQYGADVLRLWCISENFTHNQRIGKNMMLAVSDNYRKIRNTFRYLLSNLYDFDAQKDTLKVTDMLPIDRYALSRLHTFLKTSCERLDKYEFHVFYQKLVNYCSVELSSTYLDIIKDRLYCDKPNATSRRSAQSVLYAILDNMVKILSPFLPFTMEEIWQTYNGESKSVHLELLNRDEAFIDEKLESDWSVILKVRDSVLVALERFRETNQIGKSLEAFVYVACKDESTHNVLLNNISRLNEVFITSGVLVININEKDDNYVEGELVFVKAEASKFAKCTRCWGHDADVGNNDTHPELCPRCIDAIG